MKKLIFTYLSLVLILSSVLSSPLSIVAAEVTNDNESKELETISLDEVEQESDTEIEQPVEESEAEVESTPEDETSTEIESTPGAVEEENSVETQDAGEETSSVDTEVTEEEVTAEEAIEEVEEEKRGFTLEIKEALNLDEELITKDNALGSEETFILELEGNLDAEHNYEADDKLTFNLPESVVVAEAVNDVTAVGNSKVANYTVNNNGVVEVAFLDAAETVSDGDMKLAVEVAFNVNYVAEDAVEAVINPIGNENAIVVPLAIDEEVKARVGEGEDFILEINSFLDMNENEISEENANLPGLNDEFIVRLNWEVVDGHNYTAGDTVTFTIPDALDIYTATNGTLSTATGEAVVNYVVNMDGTVEFTFLQAVQELSQISGFLNIYTSIDNQNAEVADGEVIVSPIGEEGEKRIPINMREKEKR